MRSYVAFWTTGIVALILLVKGISVNPLLSKLNFDNEKKQREELLQKSRTIIVHKTIIIFDRLRIEKNFKASGLKFFANSVMPQEYLVETTHVEGYRKNIEQVLENTLVSMQKILDSVRRDAHEKIVQQNVSEIMSLDFGEKSVKPSPIPTPSPCINGS